MQDRAGLLHVHIHEGSELLGLWGVQPPSCCYDPPQFIFGSARQGLTGTPHSLKHNKTRNAWQSLAYSPLGAIVSPPSEYL